MEKKICTVIISMLSQIVRRHNQRKTFPYIVIRGSFVSVCVCVYVCGDMYVCVLFRCYLDVCFGANVGKTFKWYSLGK